MRISEVLLGVAGIVAVSQQYALASPLPEVGMGAPEEMYSGPPEELNAGPSQETTDPNLPEETNSETPEGPVYDENAKYFHEPQEDNAGHYDIRFYHGIVPEEERKETLRHLIRSYLDFCRDRDIETWIAHGTLLGWWWNSKILPWDWDLDVQVTDTTLSQLAEHHNMTISHYNLPPSSSSSSADDNPSSPITRDFILDVNPFSTERVLGDGMNVIDARWIDMSNGLYIDITGLSEVDSINSPGILSCKNNHSYPRENIFPLQQHTFEGVPASVPRAYEQILIKEYGEKALVTTDFEGHRWNAHSKEWIPITDESEHNHQHPNGQHRLVTRGNDDSKREPVVDSLPDAEQESITVNDDPKDRVVDEDMEMVERLKELRKRGAWKGQNLSPVDEGGEDKVAHPLGGA